MRLVQLTDGTERFVALVDEPKLLLLDSVKSVFDLASLAIRRKTTLSQTGQIPRLRRTTQL